MEGREPNEQSTQAGAEETHEQESKSGAQPARPAYLAEAYRLWEVIKDAYDRGHEPDPAQLPAEYRDWNDAYGDIQIQLIGQPDFREWWDAQHTLWMADPENQRRVEAGKKELLSQFAKELDRNAETIVNESDGTRTVN